ASRAKKGKWEINTIAEHAANKLLVLGTFVRGFTFQNEDGTSEEKTTMGLIFSSKCADGTYKLHHGGWVLCDLGVHICRWDSSQRKHVHTFYPLLYMFCRTECYAAYLYFFKTLWCIPEALFGMSDALNVRCGGLDRSVYIADVYTTTWPTIILLLCWPHLARKFKEGEFLKALVNKDNLGVITKHPAFAKRFEVFFIEGPWGNWHLSVSGIPGVMPTQNGIEAGHKMLAQTSKKAPLTSENVTYSGHGPFAIERHFIINTGSGTDCIGNVTRKRAKAFVQTYTCTLKPSKAACRGDIDAPEKVLKKSHSCHLVTAQPVELK
ncbi:hypothetical protein T492DRAFT_884100, partial [Pavlovales sp. CCMP2436]